LNHYSYDDLLNNKFSLIGPKISKFGSKFFFGKYGPLTYFHQKNDPSMLLKKLNLTSWNK